MKLGFVFPGQGAQYVGMGKDLLDRYTVVRDTFAEADEALGFSLSRLILEGPEADLRLTYHTQPALLTTSIAAYRAFRTHSDAPADVMAGHSLGEYTALVAAGALSFSDAVRLVHLRGRWMDEAVPAGEGAMSAVMGMESNALEDVCREVRDRGEVVELANLNCPGQIVISGTLKGVELAGDLAKERGARRVIPLVVSGPFHCSLMKKASERLSAELKRTSFVKAQVPVVANVDAKAYVEPTDIVAALEKQLYSSVRWQDDVETMATRGVDTVIEFGPGTVLSGLIKKIDRRISTLHVEDESSLQEVLAALQS